MATKSFTEMITNMGKNMMALSTKLDRMEQKIEDNNTNKNFTHVLPSPFANFPPAQRIEY